MDTESNIETNLRPIVEPLQQLIQNTATEANNNTPIVDRSSDPQTQSLFSTKKVERKWNKKKKKRKHDEAALTPRMHLKKKKKIYSSVPTNDDIDYVLYDNDDDDDGNNGGNSDDNEAGGNKALEPIPTILSAQQEKAFESSPMATASLESSVRNILKSPETHRDEYEHLFNNLGPLASKYLHNFFSGPPKNLDNVYRVYFHNNKLMLGNTTFDVESNGDIVINKIRYKGTSGLYELIIKRIPDENLYTETDKNIYRNILIATRANQRGNQIMGNKSYKYKNIIGPMFSTLRGKGIQIPTMMRVTNNLIDYVHWDDPNELVDRLKLLMASKNTGHTVMNEMPVDKFNRWFDRTSIRWNCCETNQTISVDKNWNDTFTNIELRLDHVCQQIHQIKQQQHELLEISSKEQKIMIEPKNENNFAAAAATEETSVA
nr:uncharacterized protein LOC117227604 [Megalopta genalis]